MQELNKKENNPSTKANLSKNNLVAGEHYYFENGYMVFTANYHLQRGYCCKNGCRHCPYPKN
jgi:hypothetical protein